MVVVASVVVVVVVGVGVVLVRSLIEIKFLFRMELACLLVVLVVQMAVVVPSVGACMGMVDIDGFAGLRE